MSAGDDPRPRRWTIRLLAFLPTVSAARIGSVFLWGLLNKDDHLPSVMIGRPIPEFSLPPIERPGRPQARPDRGGRAMITHSAAIAEGTTSVLRDGFRGTVGEHRQAGALVSGQLRLCSEG